MRCFNLQNDAYIISQCTSHFYWNLNGCYGRICKWTRFPIRLGVNRLKMQLLITPLQYTLGPQKFNWVISGLMFTSDFNFINIWTVFPFTTVLPWASYDVRQFEKHCFEKNPLKVSKRIYYLKYLKYRFANFLTSTLLSQYHITALIEMVREF